MPYGRLRRYLSRHQQPFWRCVISLVVGVGLLLTSAVYANAPSPEPIPPQTPSAAQTSQSASLPAMAEPATKTPWKHAQTETAPEPSAPFEAKAALAKALSGLLLILLFIAVCAFVAKKWLIQPQNQQVPIKLLASLPLGTKEKIAIVDIAGKQLVLGVTAFNITTLTEFSEPLALPEPSANPSTFTAKVSTEFAKKLQDMMTRGEK